MVFVVGFVFCFSLFCGAEMKPGASLVSSYGCTTELCPVLTLREGGGPGMQGWLDESP